MLTVKSIATKGSGFHADRYGLYLKVAPGGSSSWVYRYQLKGRRTYIGLGSTRDVGLAEARDMALEQRRRIKREGADPAAERSAAKVQAKVETAKAMTFRECATAYIEAHKAGWKNAKHEAQWTATLAAYAYPVFGDLPVADIDTGLVLKAIEPIWSTKSETATRVRSRIENVLDWARVREYRTGENPARWKGHLAIMLPAKAKVAKVEHHAALPYGEVGAFMAALRSREGLAARALEFAILTAARSGEVLGAMWREIDFEAATWTIPAERMKAGRPHKVPLTAPALAILRASPQGGPDDRPFKLSNMALTMTLRRMERGDVTPHRFRSTFRDWAAERTSFPAEVAEMALAHAVGDKVEAAYRRGDLFEKRRQLADAWSRFCAVPAKPADNVVAINS